MRRRQLIASILLPISLSGCTDNDQTSSTISWESPKTNPQSQTPSEGTTSTTESRTKQGRIKTRVPTESIIFSSAYRYATQNDEIGVKSPDKSQFAFINPSFTEDHNSSGSFSLELGKKIVNPITSVPGFQSLTPGIETIYTGRGQSGWLMFDVPTVEVDHSYLTYDDTRFPIESKDLENFTAAPDFTLLTITAPDSVASGETINLEVSVRNEGGNSGTFLAGFRRSGQTKEVNIRVKPGAKNSTATEFKSYAESGETEYFIFTYSGGERGIEVPIE